eukprot:7522184-Pyramimonas_sp.AAC.1
MIIPTPSVPPPLPWSLATRQCSEPKCLSSSSSALSWRRRADARCPHLPRRGVWFASVVKDAYTACGDYDVCHIVYDVNMYTFDMWHISYGL